MSFWQGKSKKKPSGGKMSSLRKKRQREIGRDPLYTKLGEKVKHLVLRKRGGKKFHSLRETNFANISENGIAKKVKIKKIVENPASRHFVRQNVISKGAIIETEKGLAKVTSRPTRDGTVNAVLVKK